MNSVRMENVKKCVELLEDVDPNNRESALNHLNELLSNSGLHHHICGKTPKAD
ncbi:MAG: hypothetical protein GY765_20145 [bacterium]|nr:hypothetical protein [bacterium]